MGWLNCIYIVTEQKKVRNEFENKTENVGSKKAEKSKVRLK